ncbi:Lrp/AsnC family transcriptional regulator [Amycolatopsis ultiminotia]|uniref:Lrp/AsnC family transcriptional regulator n=1 Tax=Amycolatopsis ultiminotia TaxID=543629 RepID=A0ABP6WHN6_9PSEU
MDRIDTQIVDELQRDARIPLRDLAEVVGVAASTCSERIRRLERRGIITGFHADVDLVALGRPVQALVSTQVRPLSRQFIERFYDDAMAMPEVIAVFVLAGGDDFLLHVGVGDVQQLHSFLVDKLSNRKEVTQFRSSIIFTQGQKRSLENLRSIGMVGEVDRNSGRTTRTSRS